ncbi:MAG TPA: glycosyltransferase family 4 protein [Longimicrobium sp.]|nr:glycosyltransferase family 4 protein [Longimicrobium sp.]
MPITILALLPHYLPGYKSGGPVRSVENIVERLGDPFTFLVVTRDRDQGDQVAFPGVDPRRWYQVGKGRAIYLAPSSLRAMRRVIRGTPHDVLYLNSLFSPTFTLVPLLLRRLRAIPPAAVVLAPRGELHPGALETGDWHGLLPAGLAARLPAPRKLKKLAYIAVTRALGLFRGVTWQASNPEEAEQIRRHMGAKASVVVAPDLAKAPPTVPGDARDKPAGTLRVVWLSRIDGKKNLQAAIAALAGLKGQVGFDLYGPVDDDRYWSRCRAALGRLPANVTARYHGPVPHEWVPEVFRAHDLFLFPTWGENYGHVVPEALVQGCPVLVSDRTPWRDLGEHGAGWVLPPEDVDAMRAVMQRCVDMSVEEYRALSRSAAEYGRVRCLDEQPVHSTRELFYAASGHAGPPLPPRRALAPHG